MYFAVLDPSRKDRGLILSHRFPRFGFHIQKKSLMSSCLPVTENRESKTTRLSHLEDTFIVPTTILLYPDSVFKHNKFIVPTIICRREPEASKE